MKSRFARRAFLKRSAAALGLAAPAIFPSGFLGAASPNERIATGHVGLGGMGTGHLNFFRQNVTALCDVDEAHLKNAAKIIGRYVPLYKDFRKLLDQRDLDGIVVATPDHWHGVMTVLACEAGKDVYVQKPASKTIEEGRAMVEAAERCGRVVQVGSQGRSTRDAYKSCCYIQNGQIGRVKEVDCWHYENPVGGFGPDSDPPPGLDWDLWLGPVRYIPYNRDRVHFNFRWMLEFGGGQIRDRGAHVMSVTMWIMASDHTGPATVKATGTPPKKGVWDCPPQMEVKYEFKDPDWVLWWRQPGTRYIPRRGFGARYLGEKGSLVVGGGDGGTYAEPRALEYEPPDDGVHPYKSPGHEQDWLNCIRTRQQPIMHIEAGHRVATLCILGNISYRLGRQLNWDPVTERVIGDEEANRMLGQPNRTPWHV